MNIDFNNTEVVFRSKSNKDLFKKLILFKVVSNPILSFITIKPSIFLLNLKIGFIRKLFKSFVFDLFCGGETLDECSKEISKLYDSKVYSALDYSVEGVKNDEGFDEFVSQLKKGIDYAKSNEAVPFVVFKPTAIGNFDLYHKKAKNEKFTNEDLHSWNRVIDRFNVLAEYGATNNVELMIDAEESWIQGVVDDIVLDLMKQHNKQKAYIFTTIQAYRWDRLAYAKDLNNEAKENQFKIGVKLVRGAYMEKENDRAKNLNEKSPICESKEITDNNYNSILEFILSNISNFGLVVATHNKNSTRLAIDFIEKNNLNSEEIWFSQLLGMSDDITFNLSNLGFNSIKYVPYGNLNEVMPYLLRRADENSSVNSQSQGEIEMIQAELIRRKKI